MGFVKMGGACCKNALDKVKLPRPVSSHSDDPSYPPPPDPSTPWPGDTFRRAPPHEVPTVHPDGFPSEDKSADGRSFPSPVSTSYQQNPPYHSSLPSPPSPVDIFQSSSPPTAASSTVQGMTALTEREEDRLTAIGTYREVTTGDGGLSSCEAWGDPHIDTKMQRGTSSSSSSGKAMATSTQGLSLRNRLSRNLSLSRSKPSDPFVGEEQEKKNTRREGELGGRFSPRRGFSASTTTSHRRPAFPEDKKSLFLPSKRRSSWQLFTSTAPRDEKDPIYFSSSSQRGGGGKRRSERRFFSSLPRRRQDDDPRGSGLGRQHFFERLRRRRGRRGGSFGGDVTMESSTRDNEGDGYLSSRFPSQPHDPQHFVTYPPPPSADSSSVCPSHQKEMKEGREKSNGSASFSMESGAKPPFPERQVTEETAVSEGPFTGVREGKKNGSSAEGSLRLPEPKDDKGKESRRFSSRGRNFFSRFSSRRRSDSRRKVDEQRTDGFLSRSKSFSPINHNRRKARGEEDEEKKGKREADGGGSEEKKGQGAERQRREGGGVGSRLRMIATRRRSFGGKGRREEKDFSDTGSTALGDDDCVNWTVPHWEDEKADGKDESTGKVQEGLHKEQEENKDSLLLHRRNERDGEQCGSSSSSRSKGHEGESDRQNSRNRDRTSGTRDTSSILSQSTGQGGKDQRDGGTPPPPFFSDEAEGQEREERPNKGS